ncbi:iron-containing alcohol dehydrogenase [Candidatus Poribacteria bacterium]|nr:iron-containing alcohol dehydrogenase [Candidatus Poribacteria bacterium]
MNRGNLMQIFQVPTKILMGEGVTGEIGTEAKIIGATVVLVVTDEGVRKAGLLERVILSLEDAGIKVDIFDEVMPDPTVTLVEKGAAIIRQKGHDLIIAVGGGSSIDAAKGVSVMATNEGSICDFEGVDKFANEPLPIFAVPTTAGTGSEVTFGTVLTDTDRNYKFLVYGNRLAPRVAFLDPIMVSTAPPSVVIPTGMDALTHAIESYISLRATPQTEALAISAIKLIAANLRQAVANSGNLEAVGNMLIAANLAGIAFGNSRLGIVHALALPLGAFFHVPHGVANTILLPYGLEFNLIAAPQKYVDIANAMGEITIGLSLMDAAEKTIESVKKLASDIGAPKNLKSLGVEADMIPQMAADAMKSSHIPANPRKISQIDVEGLYRRAL